MQTRKDWSCLLMEKVNLRIHQLLLHSFREAGALLEFWYWDTNIMGKITLCPREKGTPRFQQPFRAFFFLVQPVPWTWSELAFVQCDQLCSHCSEGVCSPSGREQSLFPFLMLHCHVNTLHTSGQARISAQHIMFQNRCINFAWGT